MKRFSPDDINNAADQFDPSRSPSENLERMHDHLSQFTGPLTANEQRDAGFALEDELARRRGLQNRDFES